MRFQEAEERPKLLQELGHRLQYYATIAGEFRNKVSGLFLTTVLQWGSLAGGLQMHFQMSCELLLYRSQI